MKKIKTGLTIILFLIGIIGNGQNQTVIDSLLIVLKNYKADTNKVITLINLSAEFESTNDKKAKDYLYKALELSRKIGYKKGLAKTYVNLGYFADNKGNYKEALNNYTASLKIWKEISDKKNIAYSLDNIGTVYANQGNYPDALENFFESLKIWKEIGNKQGIATSYNNLGNIYDNQGNYPEALKNHFASLKLREEIGDKDGIATSYNNIGANYEIQNNYTEALKNYFNALKIWEGIGKKQGIASIYNNIGNIYSDRGNNTEALKNFINSFKIFEDIGDRQGMAELYNSIGIIYCDLGNNTEALKNHLKSLKIKEENGDIDGIAISLINMGTLYTKLQKTIEARDFFNKALLLSKKIGNKDNIKCSYHGLTILDSIQGNFKAAFDHHKLFVLYKDSLDNEETKKKIIQTQMTYEFEKKETAAKAEQDKKDALTAAESKKQKLVIRLMVIGLVCIIVFAIVLLQLFLQKKKANILLEQQKEEISSQRDEIETQRDLVTTQKEHIEEIYREISDSISYAERIQQVVMPNLAEILSSKFQISNTKTQGSMEPEPWNLKLETFILFKPKDVVSGDFYWATFVNKWFIVTVADCTGHGVPGAFMSMLGISFLNEIVSKKEVTHASQVLDQLRNSVIDALKQKGSTKEQKDGMDISLCAINTTDDTLQFAGANNPIYIVSSRQSAIDSQQSAVVSQQPSLVPNLFREADKQLLEVKPDKQPVAIYENMTPFTNHVINLQKGDMIYLTSDGYQDQFGGSKNKKFMAKQLKELFVNIAYKPMNEQKEILDSTFENWKGKHEQIDDVTILGLKI